MNDKLDESLTGHMDRFNVRLKRPDQAGKTPAIESTRPRQPESAPAAIPPTKLADQASAAKGNQQASNDPDAAKSAPEAPTKDTAAVLPPEDENAVLNLLPADAIGKRALNAIRKEVDRWEAPKLLGKHDERRFRTVACMARFVSAIDVSTKHQIGRFLKDAKEKLKHGEFAKFIEIGCGLAARTARKYMRIAEVFPDTRLVAMLGFDWCENVVGLDLPQNILDRLYAVESRTEAEAILQEWEDAQAISAGWLSLFPNGDPVTSLGRDFALKLAKPPYVREFREFLVSKGVDQAETLMNQYNALLPQFEDGQAVVRALRGEQPSVKSATAEAISQHVFRAKNLRTRLDSLVALEGLPLDDQAQNLARGIEEQLLALQRLLEGKAAP